MKLLLALVVTTAALATTPTASACPTPEACVGGIEVCLSVIPWACTVIDPDSIATLGRVEEIVRELIGPCTCDPVQ